MQLTKYHCVLPAKPIKKCIHFLSNSFDPWVKFDSVMGLFGLVGTKKDFSYWQ